MLTHEAIADAVAALDREALAAARWFGAKGRVVTGVALDAAFELPGGGRHVLAIASLTLDDGTRQRYTLALTGQPSVPAGALRLAEPGDGTWRALALAMASGQVIAASPKGATGGADGTNAASVTAALVCRPAPGLTDLAPDGAASVAAGTERDLGADQSNTSVVLGERLLSKAYRRLQPGLNPDLELTAFLGEEAGFSAVPRLAGFAELITADGEATTVAMLQEYVAGGADAFESIAESVTAWLLAPGEVTLEYATEIAADIGMLTAGMHAALADAHGIPEMAPRPATRDEIRSWRIAARRHHDTAVDVTTGEARSTLRELAPRIAEALTVLDALSTTPEVIRAHGDYHLGQVLIAPDGFRIIDFEGEPLASPEERRAHRSPLRDVASMLRSLDHVGRSAGRRAVERNGGPLDRPGLDLGGWLRRSRERFLEAYQAGLREARVWVDIDPDLLRAFEIDKELYEFAYAATYLPSWSWAPTEGMRGLFEEDR